MLEPLAFFTSIAFSGIAWGSLFAQYVWPELRLRPRRRVAASARPPQFPFPWAGILRPGRRVP